MRGLVIQLLGTPDFLKHPGYGGYRGYHDYRGYQEIFILVELGHLSYWVHPTSWGYLVMVVIVVILVFKKKQDMRGLVITVIGYA